MSILSIEFTKKAISDEVKSGSMHLSVSKCEEKDHF